MSGQTICHIFEHIENLKREIALLKKLIQQAIGNKKIEQDILVDDVAYLEGANQDSKSNGTLGNVQHFLKLGLRIFMRFSTCPIFLFLVKTSNCLL
jgi:hypothetical protein